MKTLMKMALPMTAALALTACGGAETDTADTTAAETTEEMPAEEGAMTAETDAGTIVAVAQGNENFSTLVAAVTAAGLGETLSGAGPFTVFAPTNEAFAKVDKATLDGLLKPESKDALTGILTYHVVSGKLMAADVAKAITDGGGKAELTTVQGQKLTASMEGDKVILTDANGGKSAIAMTDVAASNGVIHAIDTVIMPKN
jgi:uncharacterized surface protein with fasciclin (FAS1) repeats